MTSRQLLMADFLQAMYKYVPRSARVMDCQFRGDPNDDIKGKWVARPLTSTKQLDDGANVYVAVSAMKRNERGEFRRRKENFAGGILLMIDDIGTGSGSKFPKDLVSAVVPTALIETSPQNFQAVYMFDSLIEDAKAFESLINGFIDKQFLGKDTGMAGINRVFRPPFGVNGKAKYKGWKVRCQEWNPDRRYSTPELADAFGIDLSRYTKIHAPIRATIGKKESIQNFVLVRQALRDSGMLKMDEPDMAGWQNITCPWTEGHTGAADNGAAIREPAEENGWCGAFRCHHGTCEGRGWRELTEWLSHSQEYILESVNDRPPSFLSLYGYGHFGRAGK